MYNLAEDASRPERGDEERRWYVLYTQPQQESRADSNLRAWGVETFSPRIKKRARNTFTGKMSFEVKPLFPRYIFARFYNNRQHRDVQFTRGVKSIVSFGGEAVAVPDEIIEEIRVRTGEDGLIRLGEELHAGDRVRVTSGLMSGFVGIFQRSLKDYERVFILLNSITFQPCLEVERCDLVKY
jgi:transcriptional antiterminator RfaH